MGDAVAMADGGGRVPSVGPDRLWSVTLSVIGLGPSSEPLPKVVNVVHQITTMDTRKTGLNIPQNGHRIARAY